MLAALLVFAAVITADPPLSGRVLDEDGRPVIGATLTVFRCYGTCFPAGHAATDADGRYAFQTLPSDAHPLLGVTLPGRYEVSRNGTLSYSEPDPQVVDFVLGTPASLRVRLRDEPPAGWERSVELAWGGPADVEGAPGHRYDLDGRESYRGRYFETVPRNDRWHVVVRDRRRPAAALGSEPPEKVEATHRWPERTWTSPPLTLPDTQQYTLRLEPATSPEGGIAFAVTSLRDGLNSERVGELLEGDGLYGPPLTGEAEAAARRLLTDVLETAEPWLGRPQPGYSYTYRSGDAETRVEVTAETLASSSWKDISRVRGFAWMPPLRWLSSQPENVVLHGHTVDGGTATIAYRLREPRGRTFGIGLGPWGPFTQGRFTAGELTVDVETHAVREHRVFSLLPGVATVETYGDPVPCGDGLAPSSLETKRWRLDFTVHGGRHWLLDTARPVDSDAARVTVSDVRL